ncbi:MAG: cell division protein FtsA [Candidatus Nealsonbacteria bacterium CG_4_9_14_0_2_um_filter_37_38]|uniref:Cell division protein FtsA n=1 Tax=Candidatus Nealsonbacteria bacterium CG_4_10_14_0_8_um_filter_37_14 TaxID=1974684 RepID=A0A2M7R6K5_9BACT|nr:MAG: cell division protein FtsA [Candidatus Nealsonbacteria bacterium CG11_big_fil_rev_8_21_14_0_20_37_68]PIW92315.1 MAG: cell division protein FtsA [Candidatus Nealsonbacteria bacterium CG_4_8_14_3_um_filter_37_23]PIY89265.1 MAG: cell division protein FtsA [Candidatus Nealsonbacteria bacterium CG_4_10_14_0_8_um_filter_37_14]PJC51674.1 MAG: cell division protein FtsA [Candidatus Nealsonbacteria bacterium CG_4_9_14_0_2_um_filter_37_38]
MPKSHIVTGLDIGTSAIKALTVLKKKGSQDLEVLSKVLKPNSGMRRGVIVKPEEVSRNIASVLDQIRTESGQKIDGVYVNIGGSHIFLTSSRGSVVVSRADQSISREDIERAIQAAKTFSLPPNREIIDFFPKQFIIDKEPGIKEPLGMRGVRLEVEILAMGAFSPYFKNLTTAVLSAGTQILDIICSSISSAKACLTPQQKELGVVLLDIGAGTTDLAIYEEGALIHLAVIPIGSGHITNDIAIGIRTDMATAERIKKEFVHYLKGNILKTKKKEKIGSSLNPLTFSPKLLRKIIEARVCEIFDLVQKEIKKVSSVLLPAGIVITGGGAKLPNIVELAKKELKLPCRIGTPIFHQILAGKEDSGFSPEPAEEGEDPVFSTAWGLVLSAIEQIEQEPEKGFPDFRKRVINRIKRTLGVFIP